MVLLDSAPTCRNDQQELSAQELLLGLVAHLQNQANLAQALGASNWLVSPSAEMGTAVVVEMDQDVHQARQDQEPPVLVACQGCASRWLLVSLCSSKSQITVLLRRRRGALTAHPLQPVAVKQHLEEPKQLPLFLGLQPPRHQPQGDQASDLALELVDSEGLDDLTGMTARSWKLCAANHRKNSAKKSTLLAKTMMPSPLRQEASLVNSRPWFCPPAWRVLPSREPSTSQLPSQLLRSGSGVRKPHVSVSGGAQWNFVQQGRPNRYVPR